MSHHLSRGLQLFLASLLVSLIAALPGSALPLPPSLQSAEETAEQKLDATDSETLLDEFPFFTNGDGSWYMSKPRRWVSGFFPGSLWLRYAATNDAAWRIRAEKRQGPLERYKTDSGLHDLGFLLYNSYGKGFKYTGEPQYSDLLLESASSLADRYDPSIGMIRTWDHETEFRVYVDTLMNLELLFWAGRNGGGRRFLEIAHRHSRRVAEDFIRPDGSTYHYVAYSETTDDVIGKGQGQGFSDESTWARGQAWGIYGMTVAYRETGDQKLLAATRRLVDYWVDNVPEDGVPHWDFDAPGVDEPKDSSAAAIVSSALLELAWLEPVATRRDFYREFALRTLESLSSPEYLSAEPDFAAVLKHGTYHQPRGLSDHGTSWGDYYFREALDRAASHTRRVQGIDRYQTASRSCQQSFSSSENVIIASGENFPDALSAASLAGLHDAPVLLTRRDSLPDSVMAEVRRLEAKRAVIVGGEAAVGSAVHKRLVAAGLSVERVAGRDRYETAARVAELVAAHEGWHRVFVVRGDHFADAVAVAALAYRDSAPILLTRPSSLPASTRALLTASSVASVTIVGGPVAVSPQVAIELSDDGAVEVARIGGADRYHTAALLADQECRSSLPTQVALAVGTDFPDALVAGTTVGRAAGILLLTPDDGLDSRVAKVLASCAGDDTDILIFGGENVLSGVVEHRARHALR